MGLFSFFKSGSKPQSQDVVRATRVLVCAFEASFGDLMHEDAEVYRRYYPATEVSLLPGPEQLFQSLEKGYDVIHLFCNLTPDGLIRNSAINGTEVIEKCCASDVKLLWVASDNEPRAYITGFKAAAKRINLVMTIKRDGAKFSVFLRGLMSSMQAGNPMPVAWVSVCPQIPGAPQPDVPQTIFSAGRGGVRLQ